MSILFWRQEQWHHSGGDNPAMLVGLMVALGNLPWGLCPQGKASSLPAPFLHSVHHGLHQNGGPKSLNLRAKTCGAAEERRSWAAGPCVCPSSATKHQHSQVRPDLQADRACVLWGAWWGFFTMGRMWNHQTGVRDGLQGHAFAIWSTVIFPFPSSLWRLQWGGVVNIHFSLV